jgi:hypothetical protein
MCLPACQQRKEMQSAVVNRYWNENTCSFLIFKNENVNILGSSYFLSKYNSNHCRLKGTAVRLSELV